MDYRKLFNDFYVCEFKQDERMDALEDRLSLYYDQTPLHMDNGAALKYLKAFMRWCKNNGYSSDEINKAKKSKRFKNI